MKYVIYNNFGNASATVAMGAFVKKLLRNTHKVDVQNPQGYRTDERIKDAETVVLIHGAVGDIGAIIRNDYEADGAKVFAVDADNLESVLPRNQKADDNNAEPKRGRKPKSKEVE